MDFDIFISHASEDNETFARPLASRLREEGYAVWYDEFVLRPGDSLTERIDYGLANSNAGLVVLSQAFIRKNWPKRELAGLTARQLHDGTRLIPLWHNVQIDDVLAFSPPLADIKALRSSDGLEALTHQLRQVVSPSSPGRRFGGVEAARDLLNRGDDEMAFRLAVLALDRRLFHLIEAAKRSGALSRDFLIFSGLHAPADALKVLTEIRRLEVPPEVDIDWLSRMIEENTIVTFAATLPSPERTDIAKFVFAVQHLLRTNPIPEG